MLKPAVRTITDFQHTRNTLTFIITLPVNLMNVLISSQVAVTRLGHIILTLISGEKKKKAKPVKFEISYMNRVSNDHYCKGDLKKYEYISFCTFL